MKLLKLAASISGFRSLGVVLDRFLDPGKRIFDMSQYKMCYSCVPTERPSV